MSREIDVSDPKSLSLLDRIYLQDRERLPEGAKPVTNEERDSLTEPTQLVAVASGSALVPESKVAEALGQSDDDDDLNDWTVAELKEELERLDLPVSGTKAELVARLEEATGE
jgi:hypothetical protein